MLQASPTLRKKRTFCTMNTSIVIYVMGYRLLSDFWLQPTQTPFRHSPTTSVHASERHPRLGHGTASPCEKRWRWVRPPLSWQFYEDQEDMTRLNTDGYGSNFEPPWNQNHNSWPGSRPQMREAPSRIPTSVAAVENAGERPGDAWKIIESPCDLLWDAFIALEPAGCWSHGDR